MVVMLLAAMMKNGDDGGGIDGDIQGCQNAPATGAIASYSEVFAGCKLLEKREKKRIKKKL